MARMLPFAGHTDSSTRLAPVPDESLSHLETLADHVLTSMMMQEPRVARATCFVSLEGAAAKPLASKRRPGDRHGFTIIKDTIRAALKSGQSDMRPIAGPIGHAYSVTIPLLSGRDAAVAIHVELESVEPAMINVVSARLEQIARQTKPQFDASIPQASVDVWVDRLVATIVAVLDAKDTYTAGHSARVARFSAAIGAAMGISPRERQALASSAASHDVGKIGVRDDVLKKPGLLSSAEFEEMQAHPLIGARIIESTPIAAEIVGGIRSHHERWDGTGYPDGLVGETIPLFARIIAIADAFDAMTSGRSYSGFMEQAEAVSSLAGKDDLFDPEILKAFARAFEGGTLTMRTGTQVS